MTNEQFTDIVQRYIDTVFRVALNYLKSPFSADDITQEVFLRLYKSKTVFESEEHIRSWLIRVTINECKRDLSSLWRKVGLLDNYTEMPGLLTPETGELFLLVMKLAAKYRIIIYLYYYEGFSTKEIAKMLGLRQSTVCTRLERGRNQLRTLLQEAGYVGRKNL